MKKYQTAKNYSEKAHRYEKRWEAYLRHTNQVFFSEFSSQPEDTILDISAGTGLLAEELHQEGYPFEQFILNDLSEGMLSIADKRLGDRDHIRILNDEAEDLSMPDNSADKIICMSAFHHYEHHRMVVDEIKRVLRPGGRLYLLDWNKSGLFRLINRLIGIYTADIVNTCSLQEAEQVLTDAGFKVIYRKEWWWRYWKFYYLTAEI